MTEERKFRYFFSVNFTLFKNGKRPKRKFEIVAPSFKLAKDLVVKRWERWVCEDKIRANILDGCQPEFVLVEVETVEEWETAVDEEIKGIDQIIKDIKVTDLRGRII